MNCFTAPSKRSYVKHHGTFNPAVDQNGRFPTTPHFTGCLEHSLRGAAGEGCHVAVPNLKRIAFVIQQTGQATVSKGPEF
jgi:hypothetical protein